MVAHNVALHLVQVNTCLRQRKYEEALALLTRTAFLAPQNVSVYKQRAETYFRMGDFKSASIDFKKVLHIFDVQAKAKQALSNARSNSDTGEVAKAIAFINEQVTGIKVQLANMCNLQGALLLEQGDYDEACAFFSEAHSFGTTSAAGLTLLHRAICNVRLERWAPALADLNRYFITEQREKVSSDAMLLWAKLHWKMGLEDDARQKFELARAQTPHHPEVLRLAKVMQQESDEACRSLSFDLLSGNLSTASKALESMKSQSAARAGASSSSSGGGGGGTTDVRVILLRSIARRRQGRLIDALGEVERALAIMERALAKASAGRGRADEGGRLESSMMQQLIVQRNALLSDLGARAAAELSYPEAIALYDAAIHSVRAIPVHRYISCESVSQFDLLPLTFFDSTQARNERDLHSGGGGIGGSVVHAVAVATQPDFLIRRGEVHAAVGCLQEAFDDFFAAMMTERFNAQMLAETEGDPLPALSLGREPHHLRIEYPWVDGQEGTGKPVEEEEEDGDAAAPPPPASSAPPRGCVPPHGMPPSLIGVSARTRVKLALVHEKVRSALLCCTSSLFSAPPSCRWLRTVTSSAPALAFSLTQLRPPLLPPPSPPAAPGTQIAANEMNTRGNERGASFKSGYAFAAKHLSAGIALLVGVCTIAPRLELRLYGIDARSQAIEASAADMTGSTARLQRVQRERAESTAEGALSLGVDRVLVFLLQRRAQIATALQQHTAALADLRAALLLDEGNAATRDALVTLGIPVTDSLRPSEQRFKDAESCVS